MPTSWAALDHAVSHHLGQGISNGYGYPEPGCGPATAHPFNAVILHAAGQGLAVNVSTGDSGDYGLGTPDGVAIPADSPYVTGVGAQALEFQAHCSIWALAWMPR